MFFLQHLVVSVSKKKNYKLYLPLYIIAWHIINFIQRHVIANMHLPVGANTVKTKNHILTISADDDFVSVSRARLRYQ